MGTPVFEDLVVVAPDKPVFSCAVWTWDPAVASRWVDVAVVAYGENVVVASNGLAVASVDFNGIAVAVVNFEVTAVVFVNVDLVVVAVAKFDRVAAAVADFAGISVAFVNF